jgi:hypothetical protein
MDQSGDGPAKARQTMAEYPDRGHATVIALAAKRASMVHQL